MTRLGKFEILEEIGRGGFGIVYQANDTTLDRLAALKVLHPQLTIDPKFIANFKREARNLAQVDHPNVVNIYEIGEIEGRLYIAMRYLPGGNLADRIAQGPLPRAEALRIIREAAAGLAAGHQKGLIHRDVKPGNILFNEAGRAVVADFGVARAVQLSSMGTSTETGGAVGTPYYRAPELWRGSPPPSPATDVYSLACVLYEMLTGQMLFNGQTPDQLITRHLLEAPESLMVGDDLPVDLRLALEAALAKDPTQRPQTMLAFCERLETASTDVEVEPEPEPVEPVVVPARVSEAASDDAMAEPLKEPAARQTPNQETRKKKGWVWALVAGLIVIGVLALFGGRLLSDDGEINPVDGAAVVYVPAGDFLMGSEDSLAFPDEEGPEHTVYLDAYWIYKYEVTNAQYADFLNAMESSQTRTGLPLLDVNSSDVRIMETGGQWVAQAGYADHPVVMVSWYGAQSYCKWAGGGLPTEAQWEKAARGTDGRRYPWGNADPTCSLAQFEDCSSGTRPVGSFPDGASPYGALDMAGNVWEWVADWYDRNYYSQSPGENPTGPASGNTHVFRGGSWGASTWALRVVRRGDAEPDFMHDNYGFRCRLSEAP